MSDEAGTTRDVIETYLNLDGYPVILADTAGIREAKNEVEKKGISLALGKSKEADLNIVVIDNSSKKINEEIKTAASKGFLCINLNLYIILFDKPLSYPVKIIFDIVY